MGRGWNASRGAWQSVLRVRESVTGHPPLRWSWAADCLPCGLLPGHRHDVITLVAAAAVEHFLCFCVKNTKLSLVSHPLLYAFGQNAYLIMEVWGGGLVREL